MNLLPFLTTARREMVGPDGLEPSTPRLSSACSNQLSYEPVVKVPRARRLGGADRIRTGDRLLAKQVLYQLSYDPLRSLSAYTAKNREKITLCDQLRPRTLAFGNEEFLRPSV